MRTTFTDLEGPATRASTGPVQAIAAARILSLGIGLFLHAGLLVRLCIQPKPFLLDAEAAFRRIPFGYATFLLMTAGLYWLLNALSIRRAAAGLRYGFGAGALVWGARRKRTNGRGAGRMGVLRYIPSLVGGCAPDANAWLRE